MTALETVFKNEGYHALSFSFNTKGHPIIDIQIMGHDAAFLLDTGAASNVIDSTFAQTLSLPLYPTGQKGGGAGGLLFDIYITSALQLRCQNHLFSFDQFLAMDLATIRAALKAKGETRYFQGILGFDFFKKNKCFIDYENERVYFKNAL